MATAITGAVAEAPGASGINVEREVYTFGAVRDDVEGDEAPPSLRLDYNAAYRFRWGVKAGARTIKCKTKFAKNEAPRPSIVIKANPAVGLLADVEGFAPSGTGWQQISPIGFTATADGGVEVELRNNTLTSNNPCWFDTIETT